MKSDVLGNYSFRFIPLSASALSTHHCHNFGMKLHKQVEKDHTDLMVNQTSCKFAETYKTRILNLKLHTAPLSYFTLNGTDINYKV